MDPAHSDQEEQPHEELFPHFQVLCTAIWEQRAGHRSQVTTGPDLQSMFRWVQLGGGKHILQSVEMAGLLKNGGRKEKKQDAGPQYWLLPCRPLTVPFPIVIPSGNIIYRKKSTLESGISFTDSKLQSTIVS